jgi:hypothetical protein
VSPSSCSTHSSAATATDSVTATSATSSSSSSLSLSVSALEGHSHINNTGSLSSSMQEQGGAGSAHNPSLLNRFYANRKRIRRLSQTFKQRADTFVEGRGDSHRAPLSTEKENDAPNVSASSSNLNIGRVAKSKARNGRKHHRKLIITSSASQVSWKHKLLNCDRRMSEEYNKRSFGNLTTPHTQVGPKKAVIEAEEERQAHHTKAKQSEQEEEQEEEEH